MKEFVILFVLIIAFYLLVARSYRGVIVPTSVPTSEKMSGPVSVPVSRPVDAIAPTGRVRFSDVRAERYYDTETGSIVGDKFGTT